MAPLSQAVALLKFGALLMFCFVGGGWMIYDGVAGKNGNFTFEDVYPGIAAMLAGVLVIGLMHYLTRTPREEKPPTDSPPKASP